MTKNRTLRNKSINWIFLWRFPIQNHPKLLITEKRRYKAKYLSWNFMRLILVRKTSSQTLSKALDISNNTVWVAPDLIKALAILSDTSVRIHLLRKLKSILEIKKIGHISLGDQPSYYLQVFKDFTNCRKKTNREAVLTSRLFPNMLKCSNPQWDFQTHVEEFS